MSTATILSIVLGDRGCGESPLRGGDQNKPRVFALALTGAAAVNINGTTIHSGWIIPWKGKLLPLNDTNYAELSNKYSEVKLVSTNEISMVSRKLVYEIYKHLNEIFSPFKDIPF